MQLVTYRKPVLFRFMTTIIWLALLMLAALIPTLQTLGYSVIMNGTCLSNPGRLGKYNR